MDFSELVTALMEEDSKKVNTLIEELRPRLIAFLRIHMNAGQADAEDCVHESLISSIEMIREDQIKYPDKVVSYILSNCRNTYLKQQRSRESVPFDAVFEDHLEGPYQLQSILEEEQERLLEWCLNQLKDKYRKFMQYWFDNPGIHTEKVAERFDISVNNAWTRKHRLIKKLSECYQKKSNL